jgi:nitroreductase
VRTVVASKEAAVHYEELLELLKTRRTVRALKADPLPDGAMEKILEAARWAPTGFNMQPQELLVVEDPALREGIREIIEKWIDSDFYDLDDTREPWQGPPWTLECLWLAAHSLGVGAQPVSAVKNGKVQGPVKHLLNLPDFIYVYEMLAIGYPASEAAPPAKLVRHLDEIVHRDKARDDEFADEAELRKQIRKLRMGNVARHAESDRPRQ